MLDMICQHDIFLHLTPLPPLFSHRWIFASLFYHGEANLLASLLLALFVCRCSAPPMAIISSALAWPVFGYLDSCVLTTLSEGMEQHWYAHDESRFSDH
jgi:hypothetical protein